MSNIMVSVSTSWNGTQEMSLEQALAPEPMFESDDQINALREHTSHQSRVIGKLAALLVEKGILDIQEAADACNIAGHIKVLGPRKS